MRESSLIGIIAVSALLFGSVETWSFAIVAVAAAIVFIHFGLTVRTDDGRFYGSKGIIFSGLLLLIYPLLQLLPLPLPFLEAFHPKTGELLMLQPGDMPRFHTVSVYPFATEMYSARLLLCFMIFSVAAFGIRDKDRVRGMVKALVVFGFLLALFGLIQSAAGIGKIYWFRELTLGGVPFGPFVNRNHFAGFIGMLIPLSIGIALTSEDMNKRILYAFLGVVMGIALFFSLSRGGIVSFVGGMLVFAFIVFSEGRSKKLIPLFFFVLVLATYLLYLGISPIVERFARTDVTTEQRLIVYKATIEAFKDFPFFGTGFGTYQYIFKMYQPEGVYTYFDHAHNDYLEALLELGIVGLFIAAAFAFSLIWVFLKAESEDRNVYFYAALLSSLSTMLLHSIFDFNLHIPSNALLFSLVLGMSVNICREKVALSASGRRMR